MKNRSLWFGVGIGSAIAALLDPNSGGHRRAWLRDKGTWATGKAREAVRATARDAGNRARGVVASMNRFRRHERVSANQLEARVRSAIGRVCSHARAVDVRAVGGDVSLSGPLLAHEHAKVMSVARAVPGVERVHDGLTPHQSAQSIPSLQGAGSLDSWRRSLRPRTWAPTTRAGAAAALGVSGLAVIAYVRSTSRARLLR